MLFKMPSDTSCTLCSQVVCVRGSVFDAASRLFLRAFYSALLQTGRNVLPAVREPGPRCVDSARACCWGRGSSGRTSSGVKSFPPEKNVFTHKPTHTQMIGMEVAQASRLVCACV